MSVRVFRKILNVVTHTLLEKYAGAPTKSVRTALAAIAASETAFTSFEQIKLETQKPKPLIESIWTHPKEKELTAAIKELLETTNGEAGAILYHGTPHTENMIEQAENCSEGRGKLENRMCSNGDCAAGLYGMGCLRSAHAYSGSEFIAKIVSEKPVDFDQDRGTPYLKVFDNKHLVAVFRVINHDEIQSHKEPTLVESLSVAVETGLRAFKEVKKSMLIKDSSRAPKP